MLWDDFLNSEWHDWRGSGRSEDRLEHEDWMHSFLHSHDLTAPLPLEMASIDKLKGLRSFLLELVRHITLGEKPTSDHIEQLNGWMADGPVIRQIDMGSDESLYLSSRPFNSGWTQIHAEIAASFASSLAQGELSRFRICSNPDCLWVYYDDTRNRSKRYCDDKACGNLMKVRRFRAKQKQKASTQIPTNPQDHQTE